MQTKKWLIISAIALLLSFWMHFSKESGLTVEIGTFFVSVSIFAAIFLLAGSIGILAFSRKQAGKTGQLFIWLIVAAIVMCIAFVGFYAISSGSYICQAVQFPTFRTHMITGCEFSRTPPCTGVNAWYFKKGCADGTDFLAIAKKSNDFPFYLSQCETACQHNGQVEFCEILKYCKEITSCPTITC